MLDDDDPNSSLTSRQIGILAGRTVEQLSGREKLDFANAAARVSGISRSSVPDRFRFRIDVRKAATVAPLRRLRIANGAQDAERLRVRIAELRSIAENGSNSVESVAACQRVEALSKELSLLLREIGEFELKTP